MTRIYLIRHGETNANNQNIIQGWMDTELSEKGKRQIEALARRFADINIDTIYSSDLRRARMTAEAICQVKEIPLRIDRNLRELNMGLWVGRSWDDLVENDYERTVLFKNTSSLWRAPDGESFEEARIRLNSALKEIVRKHSGQTVAVVTHGAVIRHTLALIKGLSVDETAALEPYGANTAVTLLEFDHETVKIVFQNDASH